LFAATAGTAEFAGGLLTAFGLLGPIGPAAIVSVMIVAGVSVHWGKGLLATSNGIELPALYAAIAAALALAGFGRYSLDAALGISWSGAAAASILALGIVAGFANLAIRKTAPAASVAA
jgi:putative oxidoreductase